MRLVVVIPTVGRSALVSRVLSHLENQTRPPDEVIVSAPDEGQVAEYRPQRYALASVFGTRGLCAQRNRALDVVAGRFDLVVFFDDDFLPADDYLERAEAALRENPDWSVVTG